MKVILLEKGESRAWEEEKMNFHFKGESPALLKEFLQERTQWKLLIVPPMTCIDAVYRGPEVECFVDKEETEILRIRLVHHYMPE